MKTVPVWPLIFFCLSFGFILGFELGKELGKHIGRRESEHAAVLAGRADYYLDSEFKRQWRWKDSK